MDVRDCPRLPNRAPEGRRGWCCAILVMLALGSSPALARAQNPFAPLPIQPSGTPTVSVPTPTTTTSSGGGLSGIEQAVLLVAGLILIGGIAFLITRDARARAPAARLPAAGPRATQPPRAKRVQRSRAKAKAARRQRKRTR